MYVVLIKSRIRELVNDKDSRVGEKKFQPYLDNKLLPLLAKHVAEPAYHTTGQAITQRARITY